MLSRVVTRRNIVIGAIVLVVLLVGAKIWVDMSQQAEERKNTISLPSEQAYLQDRLTELTQNPPKSSDDVKKKTAYYDELVETYAANGKYKEAASAFEARKGLSTDGIDYIEYARISQYYYKSGDKAGALAQLDLAERALPAVDNDQNGYVRASSLEAINALREEYSKWE